MEICAFSWLNLKIPVSVSLINLSHIDGFLEPELIWNPLFNEEYQYVSFYDSSRSQLHNSYTLDPVNVPDNERGFRWYSRSDESPYHCLQHQYLIKGICSDYRQAYNFTAAT